MGIAFPGEADAWIQEWREQLNDSDDYAEAAEGWGVGFNGSFLFVVEPDDGYDGEPVYQFVDLEDGECLEARTVEAPGDVDWGFAYRGGYTDWKALIEGELGAIPGLMQGRFELDGDRQKVLQYSKAAMVMTENATNVDTEFEY